MRWPEATIARLSLAIWSEGLEEIEIQEVTVGDTLGQGLELSRIVTVVEPHVMAGADVTILGEAE